MLWIRLISGLKVKEIVGTFYEKELQKTNQKEFRVEKVIRRKLCVNIWNDKKDIVV